MLCKLRNLRERQIAGRVQSTAGVTSAALQQAHRYKQRLSTGVVSEISQPQFAAFVTACASVIGINQGAHGQSLDKGRRDVRVSGQRTGPKAVPNCSIGFQGSGPAVCL
ncbi:hypothetical protein HPB48_009677 [Haemaphysalis longicornis]|uniref:Uncharacterized protein n=1 Tax=Haemaphysalis longicornis TaxID=44386 RepID=A0A9J6GIY1_HAELO|nr:hypothetical protein HPB48_009677 [Haemaphysalis longicornis]